ncbi:PiggyBac transposable element-derived protein 3 [Plakobranchus ocellatus]|uniref:PiggyBac transposable element-derived protein 3 n=1 Tax=Plakobranchus ocellatus TaxID=259542 RepID=A0AAV4A4N2_9GAST|nr:PiggyBac transposable element-derived protein 3 [Plakobranchus ocellatus]
MRSSGTGTMRFNRVHHCPLTDVSNMKKHERGKLSFRPDAKSGVIVVRWHDNSFVIVGSIHFKVNPPSQKHIQVSILSPTALLGTTKNKGGTDRMDENIGFYRPGIRIKNCICL